MAANLHSMGFTPYLLTTEGGTGHITADELRSLHGSLDIIWLRADRMSPAVERAMNIKARDAKTVAAATDNIGLFFGADIFIAIGSILLMKGLFQSYGLALASLQLSVCAIPSALAAFVLLDARLLCLDHYSARLASAAAPPSQ